MKKVTVLVVGSLCLWSSPIYATGLYTSQADLRYSTGQDINASNIKIIQSTSIFVSGPIEPDSNISILQSSDTGIRGKNNTVQNSHYVQIIGSNNAVTNSRTVYVIGNNNTVTNATNYVIQGNGFTINGDVVLIPQNLQLEPGICYVQKNTKCLIYKKDSAQSDETVLLGLYSLPNTPIGRDLPINSDFDVPISNNTTGNTPPRTNTNNNTGNSGNANSNNTTGNTPPRTNTNNNTGNNRPTSNNSSNNLQNRQFTEMQRMINNQSGNNVTNQPPVLTNSNSSPIINNSGNSPVINSTPSPTISVRRSLLNR